MLAHCPAPSSWNHHLVTIRWLGGHRRPRTLSRAYQPATFPAPGRRTGGVEGNHRLTALTAVVLLILLFFEGLTILALRLLIVPHVFLGMLLIPPILLKLASTGYRFARYYTHARSYVEAGPPQILLRLMAPILVAATAALFATGLVLLFGGPGQDIWRRLHILAFLGWFGLMSVHVLAYVWRLPFLALPEVGLGRLVGKSPLPGWLSRDGLVVGSIILGVLLAVATFHWDTAWSNWYSGFRGNQ